ncbi:MAG: hypothetical protein LAN83_17590 [Acidobacteriia bacterium]|nr:hypothetical protein [Terriglobia bacterium]
MGTNQSRAKGFTLIAALLLLLLMSGLAVGLMYMTNTEARVGGNDMENNLAYYGAEAGMEKMTSDLGNLYTANQAPSVGSITALNAFPPDVPHVAFTEYNINVPVDAKGNPVTNIDNVKSGPNAGLVAEIIPITLSVTSQRPSGASVRMQRSVEVALIPVFQFGVFSDSDLSYFPGPDFDFAGRVATNGSLFITPGGTLTFHSKITAAKEVIRDQLANGVGAATSSHGGPVYIPNTANACDPPKSATHCINLGINPPTNVNPPSGGSYTGGPPPTGAPNGSWVGISTGTYNGWILNGLTGAKALQLPFVGAGVGPIQIIRKPPANEATGTTLSTSRLYNKAQIRILLGDLKTDLHPDADATLNDGEDVLLSEEAGLGATYTAGVPVTGVGNVHFAYASTVAGDKYIDAAGDQIPPTLYVGTKRWPLIDGWLRVEVKKPDGTWIGVTNEWLKLGFARGLAPGAAGGPNPNAILIFQQLADRNADETVTNTLPESNSATATRYNWYPINMYDAREGEVRDTDPGKTGVNATCAANGVINVVELDVGNLRSWLVNSANGKLVDEQTLNGYLLYFSDRRGMALSPNTVPPALTGEYGFEDTINKASALGTPDNALDPNNPGTVQSPEDVNQNGLADNWGAKTIMDAFVTPAPSINNLPPFNPYQRVKCLTLARKNRVSAARHVLRLVDGTLGKLPTRKDGTGGFTVASENPVYILGDYNANGAFATPDSAAAVIADAVTLLSRPAPLPTLAKNGWSDFKSFYYPTTPGSRVAVDTWYRVAIAAGKNFNFPQPQGWGAAADYGTDGGVHNFLRYIEQWPGNLNYQGSLVSLFYAQYATGVFKCCTTVYSPPNRVYSFDSLFLNPNNLPPGTPQFEDVNNVSYRQDFTPY